MTSPRWPYRLTVAPSVTYNPCTEYYAQSDHLTYAGSDLPCTGINNGDTLTVVFQKIDTALYEIEEIITP